MPRSTKHLKDFQFKAGNNANPVGGQAHSKATKALKNLTIESYREIIELVMTGSLADLKAVIENPKSSAIQVGVATSFLVAIKKGDYHVIERIAERIVGKIPDTLNVNSNSNINANISVFDAAKLREAIEKLEADV